jgi:UDP-N-acetylglucosamine 2-epimerase
LEYGTNRLVGLSKQQLVEAAREVIYLAKEDGALPLLWDGRAAYRIVDAMQDFLEIARSENGNNRDVSQTTLEL